MKLNKDEFLKSDMGEGIKKCIQEWDRNLDVLSGRIPGGETPVARETANRNVELCEVEWAAYKEAIKQFYGIEYYLSRTKERVGACTWDGSDWLIKIEKKGEGDRNGSGN